MKKKILLKCSYSKNDLPEINNDEIAFCGRSNCGKSSLINKIFNQKKLAHTSSKPGKTNSINFYNFEDIKTIVDLPGYGYAKVSNKELGIWDDIVSNYINTRVQLKIVVILMDIRRGIQKEEVSFINELIIKKNVLISIAFTKIDKLKKNNFINIKRQLLENISNTWQSYIDKVFFLSSMNNTGINEIKEYIKS